MINRSFQILIVCRSDAGNPNSWRKNLHPESKLLACSVAIIAGLLPIMWSHGAGADVMKRIAAPMIGGMVTSTILTLAVIPAIYSLWQSREMLRSSEGNFQTP